MCTPTLIMKVKSQKRNNNIPDRKENGGPKSRAAVLLFYSIGVVKIIGFPSVVSVPLII